MCPPLVIDCTCKAELNEWTLIPSQPASHLLFFHNSPSSKFSWLHLKSPLFLPFPPFLRRNLQSLDFSCNSYPPAPVKENTYFAHRQIHDLHRKRHKSLQILFQAKSILLPYCARPNQVLPKIIRPASESNGTYFGQIPQRVSSLGRSHPVDHTTSFPKITFSLNGTVPHPQPTPS